MKVLWICNLAFPEAAEQLHIEVSNKEGWVSGLMHALYSSDDAQGLELQVAFPGPEECLDEDGICVGMAQVMGREIPYYGFYEDVTCPEQHDMRTNRALEKVFALSKPDVIHCFGTEYPHALAAVQMVPDKERFLLGIQGLCGPIAESYYADLPQKVVKAKTFRDILRRDNIEKQAEKFRKRGANEEQALRMTHNITGRTAWDKEYALKCNPDAEYFSVNETLRGCFYTDTWRADSCTPHRIFVSQGDYPLKGLHYMLCAMPGILEHYPDATLVVAGNSLVSYGTWKEKLKISGYGKYLRSLIKEYGLQDRVTFKGKLTAEEMMETCLSSHVFVCCSALENSSKSLGEAMLLGMPCISADVGGLPTVMQAGEGIMYEGHRPGTEDLTGVSNRLKEAVLRMWQEDGTVYGLRAREHALRTHDREENCRQLLEVYRKIMEKGKEG
ncbi:MAG: glycosyltransferase [Lachnospiraceae bacterium]|nr:glycosyltransferase [Lachnospiraceae bacterium]